jgi:glycosyltransferase involved in cell wall biosynthesis
VSLEVSVVIPTKDRWPVLSTSALASALGQESVEHEVVVVDDGSIDETHTELGKLDPTRLKVIRHRVPSGVAHARNAGIAAASGEWIAFLDDDDLWAPHKLRSQLDAAKAAGASFAYSGAAWLDEDRRFIRALSPPPPEGLVLRLLRWNELWAGCSNVVARADVLRRIGGFDEQLFQLADWDLWIRLAFEVPAAAVEEMLVGYVMHRRSMLLTDRRDVFAEFDYLVDKHRALSSRTGVAPDAGKFWRWVAAGHLRAGRRGTAAWTFARGAYASGNLRALARVPAALLGERAFVAARALARGASRATPSPAEPAEPAWIARYRHRPDGRTS